MTIKSIFSLLLVAFYFNLNAKECCFDKTLETSELRNTTSAQVLGNFQKNYGGQGFDSGTSIVELPDGGFLVAGRTSSSGSLDALVLRLDNQGALIWEKKYGDNETDEPSEILVLDDGFLIVGGSDSYGTTPGLKDTWALKIDNNGNEIWNKTFGNELSTDEAHAVVKANDEGFLMLSTSLSIETESQDMKLIKLDNDGNLVWEKKYGGERSEQAGDIVATETGYTIMGNTESFGEGKWDIWLIGVDQEGNKLWESTFGGGDSEIGNSLIHTADGGFIIGGYTYTFAVSSYDAWVIKADAQGKEEWAKVFGGLSTDEAFKVIQSKDGNYVAAGYTDVYIADKDGNNTSNDGLNVFLIKIAENGDEVWQKSFGGELEQRAFDIVETTDEGLAMVGVTSSTESKGHDVFVVKVSKSGS